MVRRRPRAPSAPRNSPASSRSCPSPVRIRPASASARSSPTAATRTADASPLPPPSGVGVPEIAHTRPHQRRSRSAAPTDADRTALARALELTGTDRMADRPVDQLSGGELQRVWLATCLAQDTGVLLLDEPTN